MTQAGTKCNNCGDVGFSGHTHDSLRDDLRLIAMQQEGVKCNKCGDIIFSRHIQGLRWCLCESVAVDGGQEYGQIISKGEKADWRIVALGEEDLKLN